MSKHGPEKFGLFQFYGLLALLVLAPLPLGSIFPWAQSLLAFSIFALLAVWALRPSPSRGEGQGEGALKVILTLWSLVVLFAFLQVFPLPSSLIARSEERRVGKECRL